VARAEHAAPLLATIRAKAHEGKQKRSGRSVEQLLAAASKRRGSRPSASSANLRSNLEAKLAAARALVRGSRTRG